jgi:hypothetical protein
MARARGDAAGAGWVCASSSAGRCSDCYVSQDVPGGHQPVLLASSYRRLPRGFSQWHGQGQLRQGQNVTYDVQNAPFNMDTLRSIAQKFQADKVDLVFTMTTPATLATPNVISDTHRLSSDWLRTPKARAS